MNTNHTPGPWRADWNGDGTHEIHASTERSKFSFWLATIHCETEVTQAEANARLIAAAPELLESLGHLVDMWQMLEPEFDPFFAGKVNITWDAAKAAIAKATQQP